MDDLVNIGEVLSPVQYTALERHCSSNLPEAEVVGWKLAERKIEATVIYKGERQGVKEERILLLGSRGGIKVIEDSRMKREKAKRQAERRREARDEDMAVYRQGKLVGPRFPR